MAAAFGLAALQQGIKDTSEFAWGQLGSILNTKRAAKAAGKAYRKQLRRGPSAQVEGLRRAGLNPILAAGGKLLGGGGNVPSVYQAGARPGTGTLGGSSAKDIAMMPDALKMLKNQEDKSYWEAQEAHFSALDTQRRYRALEKAFEAGDMDIILKLKEMPGINQGIGGALFDKLQEALGEAKGFSAKKRAQELIDQLQQGGYK